MLIGYYKDYREFLKDELEHRTISNSKYSLRAFARDLGLSPQVVSLVLNGKKGISAEVSLKIANRLGLSVEESSYLCDLVELSNVKSNELKEVLNFRLSRYTPNRKFRTVPEDNFKLIANWYHYAILELTSTDNFQSDPAWISGRLGITLESTNEAIERLIRMGLLDVNDGKLTKVNLNLTTTQDIPSEAIRKVTSQLLQKAENALNNHELSEREFGTMTMAINPEKLPVAREMIRKFRRELASYLEDDGDKRTQVYVLATQLFSVTKLKSEQVLN